MHDGQNCFDRATSAFGNEWRIDETLTQLINAKRIPPLLVVAIDNGQSARIDELTFTPDHKHGGGQAPAYTDFLLNEVKPFIDHTYRTRPDAPHTYLGGSSLGGLVTLEIARRHPHTFAGLLVMSPSLTFADSAVPRDIARDPAGLASTRIWLDIGTREVSPNDSPANQRLVTAARDLDAILTQYNIPHRLTIDADHPAHNEPAWAARFPDAITYLLAPNAVP